MALAGVKREIGMEVLAELEASHTILAESGPKNSVRLRLAEVRIRP